MAERSLEELLVETEQRILNKDFYKKYMEGRPKSYQLGVIHRIEALVYGNPKKGDLDTKLLVIPPTYEGLTTSQYNALLAKMDS